MGDVHASVAAGGVRYDPEKVAAVITANGGGSAGRERDFAHTNGDEETARLVGGARLALGAPLRRHASHAISGPHRMTALSTQFCLHVRTNEEALLPRAACLRRPEPAVCSFIDAVR